MHNPFSEFAIKFAKPNKSHGGLRLLQTKIELLGPYCLAGVTLTVPGSEGFLACRTGHLVCFLLCVRSLWSVSLLRVLCVADPNPSDIALMNPVTNYYVLTCLCCSATGLLSSRTVCPGYSRIELDGFSGKMDGGDQPLRCNTCHGTNIEITPVSSQWIDSEHAVA